MSWIQNLTDPRHKQRYSVEKTWRTLKFSYITWFLDPDEFSVNLRDPVEIFFRFLMSLDNLIDRPKDNEISIYLMYSQTWST